MACRVINIFCAAFVFFNIDKLLFRVIWVDFSVDFVNIKLAGGFFICAFMAFIPLCIE
jgi:hypothetical protein